MIRIGIVGIGFMGRIHYLAAQQLTRGEGRRRVQPRPGEARRRLARHPRQLRPRPGQVDLSGVKTYAALDDLLADPDIDLIDVCTDRPARPDRHRGPEGRQARPRREGHRPDARRRRRDGRRREEGRASC